jgi:hypothetical protein
VTDYWAAHGNDQVPVKLVDLACLVARMRQVRDSGLAAAPVEHDRIFTCDLPRLERYLPPAAAAELGLPFPGSGLQTAGDWPLFLRAIAALEDHWTTAGRENLPPGSVPFIPMHLGDFMLYLTEAILAAEASPGGIRFLDVGAGPGGKVRVAEALGLRAAGIEVDPVLVREANRHRDEPLVIHADARQWDGYRDFEIVLLNRPVDGRQMPAFETQVMSSLRPGTVLIHANGLINPGEQMAWQTIYVKTAANPVTGIWQKPPPTRRASLPSVPR